MANLPATMPQTAGFWFDEARHLPPVPPRQSGLDIVYPAVAQIGVDHGREESYTVATVRVGEYQRFEVTEVVNMTATEVNDAYQTYIRRMEEQLDQMLQLSYRDTPPAEGMTMARLRTARRMMVELGIDYPQIEAVTSRYMDELVAFGATQFFMPGAKRNEKAEARGEALLREWLSPEQLKQYEASGGFDVTGRETGTRYRITKSASYNVLELDCDGYEVDALCFGPQGTLVKGDVMLAQKIALETNERAALKVANRTGADTISRAH